MMLLQLFQFQCHTFLRANSAGYLYPAGKKLHILSKAPDKAATDPDSFASLYLQLRKIALMKAFSFLSIFLISSLISNAQSNDPRRSSKTAAQYDAASIEINIADCRDFMYFAKMGSDRGSTSETIELAQNILEDVTEILYSMEQLAAAGSHASDHQPGDGRGSLQEAGSLNDVLAAAHGFSFDTAWAGGMLRLHQSKYADFADQKEKATNERLRAAVTEAMPILKRHITKLNTYQKKLIKQDLMEKKEAAKKKGK